MPIFSEKKDSLLLKELEHLSLAWMGGPEVFKRTHPALNELLEDLRRGER
jgi:hypothetical protein